jgi:hypothetical protein
MTRDISVPVTIRQKIELLLSEKIPSMPAGIKSALAKRSSSATVLAIMAHGSSNVIKSCLDSPIITEAQLCELINSSASGTAAVVNEISVHPKWSSRYLIKYALIRNFNTRMEHILKFIPDMKTNDLRDFYSLRNVPLSTLPYIHLELKERNESTEIPEDEIFNLSLDDEDAR